MKRLFIITGEHSGDKHAADVVKELMRIYPEIEIEAIGGENLKQTGIKLFCDHKDMSAVGFNTKIIFKHIELGKKLAEYLKSEYKPDLVLMVDYGGFNLNLSKVLKKFGLKMFYYIPPQIWASRKWRLNTVKKNISKVFTIFPFEENMYKNIGVETEYVGHPLIEEIPAPTNQETFFAENELDKNKKLISIFPGSRVFEVKNLLRLFLKSAKIINDKLDNVQFVICQAPTIKDNLIKNELDNFKDLNIKVMKNKNYELLSCSDVLMLASGTVALEAALYNTPMIISYKGPWFLYFIYLLVRCIKRVCLPNIIADKDIVPELVQTKAKSKIIAKNIIRIVEDEEYKNNMVNELNSVKQSLSVNGAARKVAENIKNHLI